MTLNIEVEETLPDFYGLLTSGRPHTPHKFEVFHNARPDHVRVKVQVIGRPKELVSFDPWHVGAITKRFQGCEQEKK